MHRPPLTIHAALMGALISVGCASTSEGRVSESGVEVFHKQLVVAFNTCDSAAFVAAYADSFTFTTSHTSKAIVEPKDLRGYHGYGCKQSPSPQVRIASEHIRYVGGQAFVNGQYVFRRLIDGKLGEETQNYTMVLSRAEGNWRIKAHHVSLAP